MYMGAVCVAVNARLLWPILPFRIICTSSDSPASEASHLQKKNLLQEESKQTQHGAMHAWAVARCPAHLIGQANANSQKEAPNDQHRHVYSPSLRSIGRPIMHRTPSQMGLRKDEQYSHEH
jgi:hypothetical protein